MIHFIGIPDEYQEQTDCIANFFNCQHDNTTKAFESTVSTPRYVCLSIDQLQIPSKNEGHTLKVPLYSVQYVNNNSKKNSSSSSSGQRSSSFLQEFMQNNYAKDKQKQLEEIYQANEIIYEEEESPDK